MRLLLVTRGIPGSGKSTFLVEQGLDTYTLSPDVIRLMLASPQLTLDGQTTMPSRQDAMVWRLLHEMLEQRMTRGETTVVDATHTTPNYFKTYGELCRKYRYRLVVIDFADVPLAVCQERNRERPSHKVVPSSVLERMHWRLQQSSLPKWVTVMRTAEEVNQLLTNQPENVDRYRAIHHIGDVQGCFTPLKEYFERYPLRDDELYIFVGDLLDRGTENDAVMRFVCDELLDRPNVRFVEGNHELYLWQWATDQPVAARVFSEQTQPQLEAAGIDKRKVARLMRRMDQYILYQFRGQTVLVTHSGLSTLPEQLPLMATSQLIHGVGAYDEVGAVDDAFMAQTDDATFQVHGHRNRQNYPTRYNERCYNLEGKVEFGGELRTVRLDENGMTPIAIQNQRAAARLYPENAAFLSQLRQNRYIRESILPGDISSFNFKPEAFYRQAWTTQTMRARGLFLNTLTNEIVIRAYDKFFNIGERRDTELAALEQTMTFPVRAWVKENGFLGLVGYDSAAGGLVMASKSTTEGDYAAAFRQEFLEQFRDRLPYITDYLRRHNVCLLFEVMLPRFDPHIIAYESNKLVLLDIVKRQVAYEAVDRQERERFAREIGADSKRLAAEFSSWTEFMTWFGRLHGMAYRWRGEWIEGFVLEDARGYQVKVKLDYYTFWRQMRTALEALQAGRQPSTRPDCPDPALAARVIEYMRQLPAEELARMDIIALRRRLE